MGVGNTLKKILDKKGMSISELAKRSKIPPTTLYSLIKRDRENENTAILTKIAIVLGVDLSDILILSDTKNLDGKRIYDTCKKLEMKPSELGFKLDFNSGFFQPGDDIDEIMEQSFGANSSYDFTKEEADAYIAIEDKLLNSFVKLNAAGKGKAVEQVEILTKVPEYQRDPDQEEE